MRKITHEKLEGFLGILCYLQFFVMLIFIYANYSIAQETKDLRIQVAEMKDKVKASKAENIRLQMEKAAIFQGLQIYKCK